MAFIWSNCCHDVKKICKVYPELADQEFVSLLNDYVITKKEFTELCVFRYNSDTEALLRKFARSADNVLDMVSKLEKLHNGIDNQLKRVSYRLRALIGTKSWKVLKMKKDVIIAMEGCMRMVLKELRAILNFVRKMRDLEKEFAVQMEKKQRILNLEKENRTCDDELAQFGL